MPGKLLFPGFLPAAAAGQTVSVSLNGTDEGFAKDEDVDIGIADAWTIAGWINPLTTEALDGRLWDLSPSADAKSGITVEFQPASTRMFAQLSDEDGTVFKQFVWNIVPDVYGKWGHFLFTWDGTNFLFYRDSVLTAEDSAFTDLTGTMANDARTIAIGMNEGQAEFGKGNHLSVAIWDVALSQEAITKVYSSGSASLDLSADSGDYASSANLQHWWQLGRDSADIGKDSGVGTPIDVMDDSQNITSADIVVDSPGA